MRGSPTFFLPLMAILLSMPLGSANGIYDPNQALEMVYLAGTAYCPAQSIQSWTCSYCQKMPTPLTMVTVLENKTTQNQGYVGYYAPNATIIVSFRGSVNTRNWIDDFDFGWYPIRNWNQGCGSNCNISHGFYKCYVSLRAQMLAAITLITKQYGAQTKIAITGHSLGAALAELATWDLLATGYQVVSSITFGTPRVGNPTWASNFASHSPATIWRVIHHRDPVPHLPPQFLNYRHAPQEVWYYKGGNSLLYKQCSATDGEDPTCSDGQEVDSGFGEHSQYLDQCIDCC